MILILRRNLRNLNRNCSLACKMGVPRIRVHIESLFRTYRLSGLINWKNNSNSRTTFSTQRMKLKMSKRPMFVSKGQSSPTQCLFNAWPQALPAWASILHLRQQEIVNMTNQPMEVILWTTTAWLTPRWTSLKTQKECFIHLKPKEETLILKSRTKTIIKNPSRPSQWKCNSKAHELFDS